MVDSRQRAIKEEMKRNLDYERKMVIIYSILMFENKLLMYITFSIPWTDRGVNLALVVQFGGILEILD